MNPKGLKKDEYDTIIIGAGVGGLVCGCYLAKAGMKVLIVEQHYKPGGYCQAFDRNGFKFDAGVHALGSCREEGQINRLLNELGLLKELKITRSKYSDLIVHPEGVLTIQNSLDETIESFQSKFPAEAKNIDSFFRFINAIDVNNIHNFVALYLKLKGKTFLDLLDSYFTDFKLKSILTILLGNMGLPASMASAISSAIFYREFILDGGYYPMGGMQILTDKLLNNFKKHGGDVIFSTKVEKIKIEDGTTQGVVFGKNCFVKSKYVVSSCDARQTFLDLIGTEYIDKAFIVKINKLVPSVSAFIVYLGTNATLSDDFGMSANTWYLGDYNIDKCFTNATKGVIDFSEKHFFCARPTFYDSNLAPDNKQILRIMITVPFKNMTYWEKNKLKLADNLIKRAERIIPNLSGNIIVKEIATPLTFYKYTLNFKGALSGWASIPSQVGKAVVSQKTMFKNLLLAGHWVMQPGQGGLPVAIFSGRKAANLILDNLNKDTD